MKKDHHAASRPQEAMAPTHWRSLEQRQVPHRSEAQVEDEFSSPITMPGEFNRRDTLKLAGASLALSALTGCGVARRPKDEILPFVRAPEHVIPGVRLRYATAMQRSEGALGLVVEAHEGRPTKIEGNPNHPASLGATDAWAQAEILKLYDPQRARNPLMGGQPSRWADWDTFASAHFGAFAAVQGKGLAFLTEELEGPTFERLLAAAQAKFPLAKFYRFDPLAPAQAMAGAQLAFGPGARVQYDLEKARVIFALDSDFLSSGPEHLKLARQFGKSRSVLQKEDASSMHRLYSAEGVFSSTGANADHRLQMPSGQGIEVLRGLMKALAEHGVDLAALAPAAESGTLSEKAQRFLGALAKDVAAASGATLVMVGEQQPAAVHALAFALNVALGALSRGAMRVTVEPPVPSGREGLLELTQALNAGQVETLVMFDVNPLHTAAGSLGFSAALSKARVVHAGVLPEETGLAASWHLPLAHFLESWSDARAWDGTVSLVQPLILPLHGARSATTLLAQMSLAPETVDKKLLEETWRVPGQPLSATRAWRRALHDGIVAETAWPAVAVEPRWAQVLQAAKAVESHAPSKDALELVGLYGHVQDGRLANVSWLQELPDGMSKLCWDNALLVSPVLARDLGIESAVRRNAYTADVVEVSVQGRTLTAPAFVLPGLAPNTVAIHLGYGKRFGDVAQGVGVNAAVLMTHGSRVVQGVKVSKRGGTQQLCSTQDHFSVPGNPFRELTFAQMVAEPKDARERALGLGGRPLLLSSTLNDYVTDPAKVVERAQMPENLVQRGTPASRPAKPKQPTDEITFEGQQWGMVVDLSACTGCNVCTVACVAENNIATVGREQVMLGRELHWIRIDRYFSGDVEEPQAMHQPVACMQCENAPCEPVCPVSATVHDSEGLNSMAYNRCIGTRYCSNNCPYKVRRFNYLDFTHTGDVRVEPEWKERMKTLKLQRNPDVTVRYRGVMEKCTYCTQRIEEAKIAAKVQGNDRNALPDGAVTPACAQACPTQAIAFGNINDPEARVAKLKSNERNYEMLQELNVRPRTSYLARIKNENEELS